VATVLKSSSRRWRIAVVCHFVLSTAGFWLVAVVAFAVAESNYGPAPWWLAPLEKAVSFGLLQPFAYWIVTLAPLRYWTWTGLFLSTAVFVGNSLAAIGVCRGLAYLLRRGR
jgi:hypothetical protein